MYLETAKRTGRMNSLRAQTRKRLAPIIGQEEADALADDLLRMVRIQIAFRQMSSISLQKQNKASASIFSLTGEPLQAFPHGEGAGEACALGQGAKLLAGLGGAHETPEYDAARAREGGAA
jgi:hypothetical protein